MLTGSPIGIAVALITFLLMIVVGSDLEAADFRRLARQPRMVVAGLLAPPILLPPLAGAIIALLTPSTSVATGLLLIAACPVGGISNAYVYLAGGSSALSLTLTTLSCLLAFLSVPLVGAGLRAGLHLPMAVHVPAVPVLAQVLLMVATPAAIGLWTRHRRPDVAARWRPRMWRVSVVLLVMLLAIVIAADLRGFLDSLPSAVPAASLFVLASFSVGLGVAAALRGSLRERVTIAIEFATRNVAVATTIAVNVMGSVEFATFGTIYFLTEVPLMALVILLVRKRTMPAGIGATAAPSA